MLRARIATLVLAASMLMTRTLAAQQLIVNGGFETGNLFGWTSKIVGDPLCANSFGVTGVAANTGNFGLSSGTPKPGCTFNSNTVVSQFITTKVGQQYNLSYIVKQQPGFPRTDCPNQGLGCGNFFTVRWKDYVTPNAPFQTATGVLSFFPIYGTFAISTDIMAQSTSVEIEIEMWAQQDFWYVDDVSVKSLSTVPEPSTWALMGVGLFAIGAVSLRRARNHAA